MRNAERRCGFSLIEVTIALLVIGFGLIALLGLFPVGLRESGLATADTTQSIFATRVLNAIQANAGEITSLTDWTATNATKFTDGILILLDGETITPGGDILANDTVYTIANACGIDGQVVRFKLNIGFVDGTGNNLRYAAIRVADDKHSDIGNNTIYYTEFRYEGE